MSEQVAFRQKRAAGRPPKASPVKKKGDLEFFNEGQVLKCPDVEILEYRNNLLSFKDVSGGTFHANIPFIFEEK